MAGKTFHVFNKSGVPKGFKFGSGGALVHEELYDWYIHNGEVWFSANFARRTGDGAKKTFGIQIPVMEDGSDFDLHIHWIITADAEFEITIGHMPVKTTPGTKMFVGNRNGRYITNPQYAILSEDMVFSDIGTIVLQDVIGSGKYNEAGHRSLGEFILPGGNNYGVEIEKVAAGSGWVAWQWAWIEEYEGTVHAITTTTTTTTTTTS